MYDNKVERIYNRIVSLAKPWLRPIVRGKETKKVEFGFKAHILQAGGICIIDHLAANAFNESTRAFISIRKSLEVLLILELMEFTQRIKIDKIHHSKRAINKNGRYLRNT